MFFLRILNGIPPPLLSSVNVDAEQIDQGRGAAFIANTQTELLHRY